MAYTISDDCIMCGACADNCPCDAISEGDGKYEINADACVDCGSCAEVCPLQTDHTLYAEQSGLPTLHFPDL